MYSQSMNNLNIQSTQNDVGSILRNLLDSKLSHPIYNKVDKYFGSLESWEKHTWEWIWSQHLLLTVCELINTFMNNSLFNVNYNQIDNLLKK